MLNCALCGQLRHKLHYALCDQLRPNYETIQNIHSYAYSNMFNIITEMSDKLKK